MLFFGKNLKTKYGKADGGYTLVELVVSMALTAILATAVASIMFPIVSIFMDMQKLSRAQMVADMVTDALRKECASAYVTGVADVRVVNLSEPADATVGDDSLLVLLNRDKETLLSEIENPAGGNTLVFQINQGYAEALYWNTYISLGDYDAVRATDKDQNQKMSIVTSRAVYRLIPSDKRNTLTKDTMPSETRPGYLHYAYYMTTAQTVTKNEKDIPVFYPSEVYDYTNPFSVAAYNGFTVSVDYTAPVYETIVKSSSSVADRRPVYVTATVKVYQGDVQTEDTLVCSREAVLCFAEDNLRETE